MRWMAGTLRKRISRVAVQQTIIRVPHLRPTQQRTAKNDSIHTNIKGQLTCKYLVELEATNMLISRFIILSILIYKTILRDHSLKSF